MARIASGTPAMTQSARFALRHLLLAARAAIGATLSARAAPAQGSARILIQAPVDRVWQLLSDMDRWPSWNPAIDRATLDRAVAPGAVFVWKSQGFQVTSTIRTVESHRRLEWTGVAFGTRAFHSWELQVVDAGVLVTTKESFTGWLPWLLRGMMQRKLDDTLPRWLATLKSAAEAPATRMDTP